MSEGEDKGVVRQAKVEDLSNIKAVLTACNIDPNDRHESLWVSMINSGGVFVAEFNQIIIAFGALQIAQGEVTHLYVKPEFQRAGYGARIYDELEAAAKKHGHSFIFLDSTMEGFPFYFTRGFKFRGAVPMIKKL